MIWSLSGVQKVIGTPSVATVFVKVAGKNHTAQAKKESMLRLDLSKHVCVNGGFSSVNGYCMMRDLLCRMDNAFGMFLMCMCM